MNHMSDRFYFFVSFFKGYFHYNKDTGCWSSRVAFILLVYLLDLSAFCTERQKVSPKKGCNVSLFVWFSSEPDFNYNQILITAHSGKKFWLSHATCHQTSSDDTHTTHCTTGYKSVTLAVFVCVCIWLDLFMSIKIEFTTFFLKNSQISICIQ